MPRAARRPCSKPGCPALVEFGRCPKHAYADAREYDRTRGTVAERGYGAHWRRLRLIVLAEEPLCRACAADGRVVAATDVDHVVARVRGGSDDRDNLQALCHACHSRKTVLEDGGWG